MSEERNEMLAKAGLNWNVRSEDLQTKSGLDVPNRIALVRDDTNQVLGIHARGYDAYQNHELLELLYRIGGQTGLAVKGGGLFKGGEKVWFQLKSNDLVLPNDRVEGYISGLNSFSGISSLAFGNTKNVISCQNSWWTAYHTVGTRLRHSTTMRPKIDEILFKIDQMLAEEQEQFEEIKRLGEVRMSDEVRELVTRKLFEIAVEEKLDSDALSTRKKNQLATFNNGLTLELAQKNSTLWGLFNGVTRYTTHDMKKGDNSEAKMFGRTGVIERDIYKTLVEMIS
jgi:phage/plasmid-like protein (TIGR03299 family)